MRKVTLISVCGFTALFALVSLFCYTEKQAILSSANLNTPLTLIIDAGHGGEDGGATTSQGLKESQLNLEIALKVEALSALLGIAPKMIRTEDISIHDADCTSISQKKASDLKNRVAMINGTENAILLSIHQNHFSEEKYFGTQVFYGTNAQSKLLAEGIQEDAKMYLNSKNHRKCMPSKNVYLMQNVNCPAVLVECGFLSNSRETELLQDKSYQKKMAMVMLKSVATMGKVVTDDEI